MSDLHFRDYLIRFHQDTPEPVECHVSGIIPDWLDGCLYRNGPGKYTFGPDTGNHVFDGLAVVHKYSFEKGKVKYQNRLVQSHALQTNMRANRLVVSDFGHYGMPDPCQNIFQRYFSYYLNPMRNDNTGAGLFTVGDELFANTDTNALHQIHPGHLGRVNNSASRLSDISIHLATTHPHTDRDGTVYNLGACLHTNPYHVIFKIPQPDKGQKDPLEHATILSKIPVRWRWNITYSHSFAMTENYFVYLEYPLCFYIPSLMLRRILRTYPCRVLSFHHGEKTLLHIVKKATGKRMTQQFTGPDMFAFHQVNAYEENNHIVLDLCGYEDGQIVQQLYLQNLKNGNDFMRAQLWRFVIPLETTGVKMGENLVQLKNTSATAFLTPEGTIHCQPEKIKDAFLELPAIHYGGYNTKKYKFVYGADLFITNVQASCIVKVNMHSKEIITWKPKRKDLVLGEPVFVASPTGKNEDDGVLLISANSLKKDQPSEMNILDARTLTLLSTASAPPHVQIPYAFHGKFINS